MRLAPLEGLGPSCARGRQRARGVIGCHGASGDGRKALSQTQRLGCTMDYAQGRSQHQEPAARRARVPIQRRRQSSPASNFECQRSRAGSRGAKASLPSRARTALDVRGFLTRNDDPTSALPTTASHLQASSQVGRPSPALAARRESQGSVVPLSACATSAAAGGPPGWTLAPSTLIVFSASSFANMSSPSPAQEFIAALDLGDAPREPWDQDRVKRANKLLSAKDIAAHVSPPSPRLPGAVIHQRSGLYS